MAAKIVLYMMVKNEESTLHKTLKTIPSLIRECVFYDTGSTDMTKHIIATWGKETNRIVHIFDGIFIDYSTSRNEGLQHAERFCNADDYIMVLDANDELIISNAIIDLPGDVNAAVVNSLWFLKDGSIMSHPKFVLIRPHKNVRYIGRVHEILYNNGVMFNVMYFINGMHIQQDRSTEEEKTRARYRKDIEMLTQDYNENILPEHAAFHIGSTYMLLGEVKPASTWLKTRIKLGGDNKQELAMSHMRLGRIMLSLVRASEMFNDYMCNKTTARKLKKHMLASYNLSADAEPLTWLLAYYQTQKKWHSGMVYARHICLLEPPKYNVMYMLNVYTYKRWCMKALFCLKTENFHEGLIALKKASATCDDEKKELASIYSMYVERSMMPINLDHIKHVTYMNTSTQHKKMVLIACGFYHTKWDGRLLESSGGVGGSELVAIRNAEYLAKHIEGSPNYEVYFCCDCEAEITVNGVHYIPLYMYDAFIEQNIIHTLYVYRLANMIRYNNVKNVYISLEDVSYAGGTLCISRGFRKVVMKCVWQSTFPQNIVIPKNYVQIIGNAIDPSRFSKSIPKNPHKFIYTSCPERGLVNLLRIFPRIKEFMPEAELHVYIDTNNSARYKHIDLNNVLHTIETTPGVHLHNRIGQEALATECLSSTYWVYPTVFLETYCITAHEMMAARVLCIYHSIGALTEVIGDRGIAINNLNDDLYVNAVRDHYLNKFDTKDILDRAQQWAAENNWDKVNSQIRGMIDVNP